MAAGLDELIDHLLSEIALCGTQGEPCLQLLGMVPSSNLSTSQSSQILLLL